MKKLLILLSLFLISCSNEPIEKVGIKDEIKKEVVYESSLWYSGYLGSDEIKLQYSQTSDRVFGKYSKDDVEVLFRGTEIDDAFFVTTENNQEMILTVSEETIYGLLIDETLKPVFCTKSTLRPAVSEETLSLSGRYMSYDSNYYEQTAVTITPLFDHLIYLDIEINEVRSQYLARLTDNQYNLITTDVSIKFTEERDLLFNKPLIVDEVILDTRYSESIEVEEPTLPYLNLSKSEESSEIIKLLLDDYYELFISQAQNVAYQRMDGYNCYKLNIKDKPISICLYEKDDLYYIWFDKSLLESHNNLVLTNDLNSVPKFLEPSDVIKKPMLLNGFSVVLEGELSDFIPDGYLIKDKISGFINKDKLEDLVLVLDHQNDPLKRIVMILIKNSQGYEIDVLSDKVILNQRSGGDFGEPYESIELKDHKLYLNLYGGNSVRWSQKHVFDTVYDYRLLESTLTTFNQETSEAIRFEYDFIQNNVVISNDDNLYKKVLPEKINLRDFNGYKLFDLDYQ
ncbi:MAG: hypothetical protein JEZ08_14795 [Clostridiales bacterium]|nr:hypothetical protein [Clostridiales bacterium]